MSYRISCCTSYCTPIRGVVLVGAVAGAVMLSACASSQFEQALRAHRWTDAASTFDADTSLQHNENALFHAAMLYSIPRRDTYDPERARSLFRLFLQTYPQSPKAQAASDQLTLLYELQRVQADAEARDQELRRQIAKLAADTIRIHARLDSLAVRLQAEQDQSAVLRKVTTRLENDLQDRENHLRDLNAELAQLKEIDLKPPLRSRTGDTSDRVKKVPVR